LLISNVAVDYLTTFKETISCIAEKKFEEFKAEVKEEVKKTIQDLIEQIKQIITGQIIKLFANITLNVVTLGIWSAVKTTLDLVNFAKSLVEFYDSIKAEYEAIQNAVV